MSEEQRRVLVMGDSITEGRPGVYYVKRLAREHPDVSFVERGVGGDTLIGISLRMRRELARGRYNGVIISAGHNDVIIPRMPSLGLPYVVAQKGLLLRGSVPAENAEAFREHYRETVRAARAACDGPVVMATLSCLSEDLSAEPNGYRAELNAAIRDVAADERCVLADIGAAFDARLADGGTHVFMGEFWKPFLIDPLLSLAERGADRLSENRGLTLTIDGVHLNTAGAELYAEVLADALRAARTEAR